MAEESEGAHQHQDGGCDLAQPEAEPAPPRRHHADLRDPVPPHLQLRRDHDPLQRPGSELLPVPGPLPALPAADQAAELGRDKLPGAQEELQQEQGAAVHLHHLHHLRPATLLHTRSSVQSYNTTTRFCPYLMLKEAKNVIIS